MSDLLCNKCRSVLMFSARSRGDGLCGPCSRSRSDKRDALRDAVILVADRCDCGSSGCRFRSTNGQRPVGGCRMDDGQEKLTPERQQQLDALSRLFHAACALLEDA